MASVFLPQFNPEANVEQLVARFKQGMKEQGKPYNPSVHDDVHILAEAVSYLLMLQHTKIEHGLSQSFLSFAQGAALDHLGLTFYGVQRISGVKPTALATFTLSQQSDYPVTIHKEGFRLGNAEGDVAYLLEDLRFKVNPSTGKTAKSQVATIVLQRAVAESTAKTNIIQTPKSFLRSVSQAGNFQSGQNFETDAEYKKRLVQSLFKNSTAGSSEAYLFFAKTAANRIQKIDAYSLEPGKVILRYYAPNMDDAMQTRLEEVLQSPKVRPVGEQLTIQKATIKHINLTAKVAFKGLVNLERVKQVIKQKFAAYADFNRTIYKTAFCLWVEDDVNLTNFEVTIPVSNITLRQGEFPVLGEISLIEEAQV